METWEPIHKAWHRDELYQGDQVERAPDIILEFALEKGYSHACLRSYGGPSFRRIGPDEYPGGKERGMNGSHRPMGVLFLSKPVESPSAALQDIAPTILAELGVAGPSMDGQALLGQHTRLRLPAPARPAQAARAGSLAPRRPGRPRPGFRGLRGLSRKLAHQPPRGHVRIA